MAVRPERPATRPATRLSAPQLSVQWLPATWPAAAVVVTLLALGGVSARLGNPDQLVTSSFVTALKSQAPASDRASGAAATTSLAQLSGSEEFWLDARTTRADAVPVALRDSLQPGDRVTIGSSAGERRFEVVDIRTIGDIGAAGVAAHAAGPLRLVTCRDVAAPDAPPLRFVIEHADTPATGTRRAPHAL